MPNFRLNVAMATHPGLRRPRNEDAIGYFYPDNYAVLCDRGALFVLADGVGSLPDGDKASHNAVERLIELYYQTPQNLSCEQALLQAIETVNAEIYCDCEQQMATTLVAVLVHQERVLVASLGDSRLYWFDGRKLFPFTRDHIMSYSDENNRIHCKLTRAIGLHEEVQPDLRSDTIAGGEGLLLVSDGATAYLNDEDFLSLMSETPRQIVRDIVHYANRGGGQDNVSAIMISVDDLLPDDIALKQHLEALKVAGVSVFYHEGENASTQTSRGHWLRRWIGFLN